MLLCLVPHPDNPARGRRETIVPAARAVKTSSLRLGVEALPVQQGIEYKEVRAVGLAAPGRVETEQDDVTLAEGDVGQRGRAGQLFASREPAADQELGGVAGEAEDLSLIHISEPTRRTPI